MLDLFERVVNDEIVKKLIERAKGIKGSYPSGCVYVLGSHKDHPKLLIPTVYCNQEDFNTQFTSKEREKYNGRILTHTTGTWNYHLLTDILDGAEHKKIGQWVIMGYSPMKRGQRDDIVQEFATETQLIRGQNDACSKIDELALLHRYGTTEYSLIETGLIPETIEDLEAI